jgi:hypothetical protein
MLARKTCWPEPNSEMATVFPFKSRIERTRSVPNSSQQPMWTPAMQTIGSPASTRSSNGPENTRLISASPEARAFETPAPPVVGTYWTSVNPSPPRNSSARYSGAAQRAGLRISLIFVVSGGGSAATRPGCSPRNPAVPASVNPLRSLRRLNGLAYWVRMETSLPDAGQCNPRAQPDFGYF